MIPKDEGRVYPSELRDTIPDSILNIDSLIKPLSTKQQEELDRITKAIQERPRESDDYTAT